MSTAHASGEEYSWVEFNQQHLNAAVAEVRAMVERYAQGKSNLPAEPATPSPGQNAAQTKGSPAAPPAIDTLARIFSLTVFERAILLLCAGMELDASVAALCASANGDGSRPYPTFGLALAALMGPHWSALTPSAPLRRWSLIEVNAQQAGTLTTSRLRIDERILHYLTGVQALDERLASLLEPMDACEELARSQAAVSAGMIAIWSRRRNAAPVIQLAGGDEPSRRAVAETSAKAAGLVPYAMAPEDLPAGAADFDVCLRLWEREAALAGAALYLDAEALEKGDQRAERRLHRLLERAPGPVILSVRDRIRPLRRAVKTLEVGKPSAEEQRELWQKLLSGRAECAEAIARGLAAQFNLGAAAIRASVEEAAPKISNDTDMARALWDAARTQARPRLEDLAQHIEPSAQWDDLVLPDREKSVLREIEAHVRHRSKVYDEWGFGKAGTRGLGISALFSGVTGTGKTMAAEVLANVLRLDLYRIDLSSVVNKYIGETEKNLRRVFDAAEEGGAILFFDEADALFGKRSDVKDSHDRYANIEINYLLQRMESYRGLAVLATNMKSAMDPAFLRRLRFAVHFPFPGPEHRAEIWRRVFPKNTPIERLEIHKLARLNIAGGNIRNIALSAAFIAADAGGPVRMEQIAQAVHGEFAKIEKPLPEAEIADW
jgi:ATPase family associated with various cellular activities (AAA)